MIPEAIYFSLFMILGKRIKEHRLKFTAVMIIQYLMIKLVVKYDVWFQLIYTFMTFLILKLLYKEKAQITDIFLFAFGSILLIGISALSYIPVMAIFNNYILAYIVNRVLMFGILYLLRNKLSILYNKFIKVWNRKPNQKVRSLTVRNVSVIIFNLMFYIINLGMIVAQFVMNIK